MGANAVVPGRGAAGASPPIPAPNNPTPNTLQGTLVFDNGLPASGIDTRLYSVGFAGRDVMLGETRSDAQGKYSISYTLPQGALPNLQVRVVDASGKEITISNTKFNAQPSETLNLVVPSSVQPPAPEFQRLSADMEKAVGGIANLGQAQEGTDRQDLTLLNQSTNWDARLVALAATSAQQATATGLAQDVLYALFRVGLPSSPALLAAIPSATVQQALTKATQAGIVSFTTDQISAATTAFQNFASKTLLASTAPGAVSTYQEMFAPNFANNPTQLTAFANLYFSQSSAPDFWTQAANLGIPATTLDALKLQGNFLNLTFNNVPLSAKLQADIGTLANISQLADKDYHKPVTWQAAITAVAGSGGDQALQALIPPIYTGSTTANRLAAYSADMARKVRISFPTQVTARMVETGDLALNKANVPTFLRAASSRGYSLGRTPLNAFLKNSAKSLPTLDAATSQSLKTLHRLFQVTPSTESLQAALKLGLTSAHDIASYPKDVFMSKYASAFPAGEAQLVYGQSQTVSAVTFNVFTMAKQLDTQPPVFALSSSAADRQNAKNALVQQFPTMASLFGNLDFCQCEDCRSVLSPAAYFVDVLDLLGNQSTPNAAGYTPLDVLVGQQRLTIAALPNGASESGTTVTITTRTPHGFTTNSYVVIAGVGVAGYNGTFQIVSVPTTTTFTYTNTASGLANSGGGTASIVPNASASVLAGRRPDLAALPLTCENTNTAMPYIDIVNEILEYYIAYSQLDAGAAYDTGTATTADLTAEPQHILPHVYTTALKQAVYPLILPFDLWIETVRGFLGYFKLPLSQVLDKLRPADTLELFTSVPATPYYRAQILAEALGLSPAEYAVFTAFDTTKWFTLYGYPTEAAALSALSSAKTLSQQLGLSYQDLVNLVETGFLNPALYPLLFQFQRFGIDMSDAFSYTGQPGYPALSAQATADFESQLNGITAQYQHFPGPPFDAKTWLKNLLPANYSKKVLVLADPDSGCNFMGTVLQYADNSTTSAATPLDFLKFNLFVRLWKKLAWSLDEVDRALQVFFPPNLPAWGDPGFSAAWDNAWKTTLVYLAHLDDLNTRLNPALGRTALLPFWTNLPTQGQNPLYAQLFLTPSVLNNDATFDDPNGQFPTGTADTLSMHGPAVQGVLSLSAADVAAILSDAGVIDSLTLVNLSLCYRYSLMAHCLQLSVSDMIALKTMSGLNPFKTLSGTPLAILSDDILLTQTLAFIKQTVVVQNSGFTVEDLQYLLRHQFDPVGKYQVDPNAQIALVQTVANGLSQIQAQNAVPPNVMSLPETLLDQSLSGVIPAPILKALFTQLTNSQIYTTSQGSVTSAIDPSPFAQESELTFSYDTVTDTQTVGFQGLLLDSKKAQLEAIAPSATTASLFNGLLDAVQTQVQAPLDTSMGDLLGVWSTLVQYQVTPPPSSASTALVGTLLAMWSNNQTYVAQASATTANQIDPTAFSAALAQQQLLGKITDPVPSLQFSYDSVKQIQTLTCRGVLTDNMRQLLTNLISSTILGGLLQDVRNQAVKVFNSLATNLITPGPSDLDNYSAPFLGVDASNLQRLAKAQLVTVFLPLLAQKLLRQFVVQTLSTELASDPSMTEALITTAAILSDPSNPGKSLLGSLLAAGQPGVSASYFASANQSGPTLAQGIPGPAVTTDIADPTNPNAGKAGTGSTHFEGYLQVPTDGPYRFFVELGNLNAQATFQLDSSDPTALMNNPIIQGTAAKDGDEASQFVTLKGGVPYHFTLDFQSLGAKGASLLIQGENLPKGPLSQIQLYPQQTILNFNRANVLLSKVLQIVQVTALDEREISYLTANSIQFNSLNLGSLPTQASDDSVAKAVALFSQILTLVDYADLRKGPAGGTDGLVDVFQAASQASPTMPPSALLATLTRRDPQVVQAVATALWPTAPINPHFQNNVGTRRLWDALQLVQIVGLPVASLTGVTAIVAAVPTAPDAIAANFKNAVKAQYTADQWRPIAQSVFDPLRRKKRDALVAYLVNALQLENSNQLFEYFLVDPGMEPVVQTSRLRLAMSSVQTFVQRCLLNLENANAQAARNVAPSAIRADWWEWMKRYRVWQANREIFLFPENWLEPELRLNKTDLFQALEGDLLQGDVTSDLVEDAFSTYLSGLELRARLDIVATYLDQDPTNPGSSTQHVLGRTYGHPHKYFYRTYQSGVWSGWMALTLDIESDHIVLAIWRGRLNIFWLTFAPTGQAPSSTSDTDSTPVGNLSFAKTTSNLLTLKPQPQTKIQLHWSEYFQGKWSNRISTDLAKFVPIAVSDPFDSSTVHVHVSKEMDPSGNEGAVNIHLDIAVEGPPKQGYGPVFSAFTTFRVTSKNCDPDFNTAYWEPPPLNPYNATGVDATFYTGPAVTTGSTELSAAFQTAISGSSSTETDTKILDSVNNNFDLLTCANPVNPSPFLPTSDPLYSDAGSLVSPFFFKDTSNPNASAQSGFQDERTFFVIPSLTETVIDKSNYGIRPNLPSLADLASLNKIAVISQVPAAGPTSPTPGDPVYSLFPMRNTADWLSSPGTAVSYSGVSIGQSGAIQTAAPSTIAASATVSGVVGLVGAQGLTSVQAVRTPAAVPPATNLPAPPTQNKD